LENNCLTVTRLLLKDVRFIEAVAAATFQCARDPLLASKLVILKN